MIYKKILIILFLTLTLPQILPAQENRRENNFAISYETSSYTYREGHSEYPISLKSHKHGFSVLNKHYGFWGNLKNFSKLELRYMAGDNTYNGWMESSGVYYPFSAGGVEDYYLEGLLKAGHIFYEKENFKFEGAFGLGYRYLRDNLQSIGDGGYLRKSRYLYIPFEASFIYKPAANFELALNTEFDWLLNGHQYSGKIMGYDSTDVSHTQDEGYGLRASLKLAYLASDIEFFIEPFIRYWHIQNSDEEYQYIKYGGTWYRQTTWEPFNTTKEFGLKIGIAF